jgi:DNA-binding response OmpR family regulator
MARANELCLRFPRAEGIASGMADTAHILVVEDEATQRTMLIEYLTRQGFQVTGAPDGGALRRALQRNEPNLVLLDLGLPGEDGHSLARHLRENYPKVAVIMVTAAGSTVDRIIGLETGADDYIPKPFEPRELLARIKSVLRRAVPAAAQVTGSRVPMGRRVLDLEQRLLVDPDGLEERLTSSEFELLRLFAENPNKPLNREWLLEATSHREAEAYDRAIDLRITRLRKKIEADPGHPDAIRTVRGVGYVFVPPGG